MGFTMRSEFDVDLRIVGLLRNFVGKKFNDVLILDVVGWYNRGLEGRVADIAVIKDDGNPLLLIETKKKYEGRGRRIERRFMVTSEEVLGQVFSYAAILKRNGVYVPFVATANESQIALFSVPEDIDRRVNWDAIKDRDYGHVLSEYYIRDLIDTYRIGIKQIRFTEEFFADILDTITGIYGGKHSIEDKRQPLEWTLIELLRGFVDFLTPFVQDAIAPGGKFRDDIAKALEKHFGEKGLPAPSPEQLAREMAYVLLNKIVFYKVLERHYNLEPLRPLYEGGRGRVRTVSEYLRALREMFSRAANATGNFRRVFDTGIYDEIDVVESEEVMKNLDSLISRIDAYQIERFGEIVGYVYENLIPAEERHSLGQYYTPRPVAELIVRWSVRSPDDMVLDPGCGSGTFLVEAYRRLAELKLKRRFEEVRYVSEDVHRQILGQLVGIDINEFPAHLTAMNLAMRNPKAPSTAINVIVEDFFNVLPSQERLVPYKREGVGKDEGAELVLGDFDAVVGNPPYTRWGELPESVQKNILNRIGGTLEKYGLLPRAGARGAEYNMVVFWIVHATSFLKDGGRLGMIISDSWLQAGYGMKFSRFLTDNYKVVAVIDLAPKVFDVPQVGTCILLAERETDEAKRKRNNTVFMHLHPRGSISVEKVLELISEYSNKPNEEYHDADVDLRVVPQGVLMSEQRRWIEYILGGGKTVLDKLRGSQLLKPLSEYFEPVYGNTLYTVLYSRGVVKTRHAGVGGEAFFYLTQDEVNRYRLPRECLYRLIPSPRHLRYFTFTEDDWKAIKDGGDKCYLFMCHVPRQELQQSYENAMNYVRLGESEIKVTKGVFKGQPVSNSKASQVRKQMGKYFFDWYDLGGVVEAPIYVARGSQYWPRFAMSKCSCALDDRVMSLIPKEGVSLDETELKALLAYLNSSFTALQAESVGRSTGDGMLELDVRPLGGILVLDVKKLSRDYASRLAALFDRLEDEARRLGGADSAENVFGSELAKELTGRDVRPGVEGLFNTVIKEIDYAIGDILGLSKDEVETVRGLVIEYARRRLARAREPQPGSLRGSEEVAAIEAPKRAKIRKKKGEGTRPALQRKLDEFFPKQ